MNTQHSRKQYLYYFSSICTVFVRIFAGKLSGGEFVSVCVVTCITEVDVSLVVKRLSH